MTTASSASSHYSTQVGFDLLIAQSVVGSTNTKKDGTKAENQDSYWPHPDLRLAPDGTALDYLLEGRLYLVADGVSGCLDGRVASQKAVGIISQDYYAQVRNLKHMATKHDLIFALQRAIRNADSELVELARRTRERDGLPYAPVNTYQTTILAVLFHGGTLIVANVGDSYLYRFREGRIAPRNETQRQKRYVGMNLTEDAMDVWEEDLKPDDLFLLCSDGLPDYLGIVNHPKPAAQSIQDLFAQRGTHGDLELFIDDLCTRADEPSRGGGGDNITTLLVAPVRLPLSHNPDPLMRAVWEAWPLRIRPDEPSSPPAVLHELRELCKVEGAQAPQTTQRQRWEQRLALLTPDFTLLASLREQAEAEANDARLSEMKEKFRSFDFTFEKNDTLVQEFETFYREKPDDSKRRDLLIVAMTTMGQSAELTEDEHKRKALARLETFSRAEKIGVTSEEEKEFTRVLTRLRNTVSELPDESVAGSGYPNTSDYPAPDKWKPERRREGTSAISAGPPQDNISETIDAHTLPPSSEQPHQVQGARNPFGWLGTWFGRRKQNPDATDEGETASAGEAPTERRGLLQPLPLVSLTLALCTVGILVVSFFLQQRNGTGSLPDPLSSGANATLTAQIASVPSAPVTPSPPPSTWAPVPGGVVRFVSEPDIQLTNPSERRRREVMVNVQVAVETEVEGGQLVLELLVPTALVPNAASSPPVESSQPDPTAEQWRAVQRIALANIDRNNIQFVSSYVVDFPHEREPRYPLLLTLRLQDATGTELFQTTYEKDVASPPYEPSFTFNASLPENAAYKGGEVVELPIVITNSGLTYLDRILFQPDKSQTNGLEIDPASWEARLDGQGPLPPTNQGITVTLPVKITALLPPDLSVQLSLVGQLKDGSMVETAPVPVTLPIYAPGTLIQAFPPRVASDFNALFVTPTDPYWDANTAVRVLGAAWEGGTLWYLIKADDSASTLEGYVPDSFVQVDPFVAGELRKRAGAP